MQHRGLSVGSLIHGVYNQQHPSAPYHILFSRALTFMFSSPPLQGRMSQDNINESQQEDVVDESDDEAERLVNEWKGHDDFPILGTREVQLAFIADEIGRNKIIANEIKRNKKADTPPAKVKRSKFVCPIANETRRAEDGATAVQVIHPSEEIPDLDKKLAKLIDTCITHAHVSSVELQVCRCTRS